MLKSNGCIGFVKLWDRVWTLPQTEPMCWWGIEQLVQLLSRCIWMELRQVYSKVNDKDQESFH